MSTETHTLLFRLKIPLDYPTRQDSYAFSTNTIWRQSHFSVRKKHKDNVYRLTRDSIIEKGRIKKINERCNLNFTFYFNKRPFDSSNTSAMGKVIEDTLVKHGILKNDNYKYIKTVSYTSEKTKEVDHCILEVLKA